MKSLVVALALVLGLIAPAAAGGGYTLENRPELVFPGRHGGIVHVSPFPASKRAASIWQSDACWRGCTSSCAWKLAACVTETDADLCRPHVDACDRSCQITCRLRGGPFLPDIFEWQ